MKKLLFLVIIIGVVGSAYLVIRTLYKNHLLAIVQTSFKKDFNSTLPKNVKPVYIVTHSSIDFPIEAVLSIDKGFYRNISKLLPGNDCSLDKSLDFLKGKSEAVMLKEMQGDIFLKRFPIGIHDFKYCFNPKYKNNHIWKIFTFKNQYYLYFFSG